jgi:hypothetical protein
MRYEVKKEGNHFKVWDTKNQSWMTKNCPEGIAKEICDDFNRMEGGDYSPIFEAILNDLDNK